jgi:hypothetical protein
MKRLLFTVPLFVILLIGACSAKAEVGCKPEDVLLTKESLPEGAYEDSIVTSSAYSPKENAGRTLSFNQDLVIQFIDFYPGEKYAKRRFEKELAISFDEDEYQGLWQTSESSLPLVASEYYYACGIVNEENVCRLIARYKNYFAFLGSEVSESGITQQQFEELILVMDQKLGTCSGNSKKDLN